MWQPALEQPEHGEQPRLWPARKPTRCAIGIAKTDNPLTKSDSAQRSRGRAPASDARPRKIAYPADRVEGQAQIQRMISIQRLSIGARASVSYHADQSNREYYSAKTRTSPAMRCSACRSWRSPRI